MELLLVRPDDFSQFYNCSILTEKQWIAVRKPEKGFGAFLLVFGVIFVSLYLICFKAMFSMCQNSRLKIMIQTEICDVSFLFATAVLITEVYAYVGAQWCSFGGTRYYVVGCCTYGIWFTGCARIGAFKL